MAGEPTDKIETQQQPAPLDYARHLGEYPEAQAHPRLIVLLIGLTALAGVWSVILGIMSLGDVWGIGMLLGGAGICLCWAAIGKLSAKAMRLRAALTLLLLGIVLYIPAIVVSHRRFVQQRIVYASDLEAMHSDFHHLPTEAESEVFTFEMIRNNAIAAMALGALTAIYVTVRFAARRGTDFN